MVYLKAQLLISCFSLVPSQIFLQVVLLAIVWYIQFFKLEKSVYFCAKHNLSCQFSRWMKQRIYKDILKSGLFFSLFIFTCLLYHIFSGIFIKELWKKTVQLVLKQVSHQCSKNNQKHILPHPWGKLDLMMIPAPAKKTQKQTGRANVLSIISDSVFLSISKNYFGLKLFTTANLDQTIKI